MSKKSICKKELYLPEPCCSQQPAYSPVSLVSSIRYSSHAQLVQKVSEIYQLIFPVMALCFSLTSAGIQTSVSRFVSSEIGKAKILPEPDFIC